MVDWDADVLGPVMAVFGEDQAVTYRPRAGAPFTLADAVYDAQYGVVAVDPRDGVETTSRTPALGVRASAFASPPLVNDAVDVPRAATRFIVKNVMADSHGHILLLLGNAAALP